MCILALMSLILFFPNKLVNYFSNKFNISKDNISKDNDLICDISKEEILRKRGDSIFGGSESDSLSQYEQTSKEEWYPSTKNTSII